MGSRIAELGEAPFPETLAREFVLCFCPPGGVVLDPFGGSGTTAAVAAKNGREFISIDLRSSQYTLTQRRLAEVGIVADLGGAAEFLRKVEFQQWPEISELQNWLTAKK